MATADADVVAAVPTLADELALDDVVAAGWEVQGPTATPEGGLTLTISHSFTSPDDATNLLNSIGPPFNQMSVQRTTVNNDTTTTLHGLLGLSNGFAVVRRRRSGDRRRLGPVRRPDRGQRCHAGVVDDVTIGAGLPGEIVPEETNGTTVEDGSLEWVVPLDGSIAELRAQSLQAPANNAWWARPLSIAALVALVAWVAVHDRSSSATSPGPARAAPAATANAPAHSPT